MHGRFIAKIFAALQNLPEAIQLRNSRVIVSLSGGPDSTALLLAASEIAARVGMEVHACHVNHQRRGEESELDEEFCRQLCAHLAVELHVHRGSDELDAAALDSSSRLAPGNADVSNERPKAHLDAASHVSEETLRDVRRRFLSERSEAINASAILLAHTSNDQVETVLFRLFRGTSPAGLSGMKLAHQLNNGVWYVRPMLNCSRDEVVEFLEEKGVSARIDASNASSEFARNFLRNEIIPLIQTRFPSMTRQIERLRETTESENELLSCVAEQAAEHFGGLSGNYWRTPEFELLHISIKRRALAKAFALRGIEVSFERLQAVLNMMADPSQANRITLNARWDVALDTRFLTWIDKNVPEDIGTSAPVYVPVNVAGYTFLLASGTVLSIETVSEKLTDKFRSRESLEVLVDLSRISGELVMRSINPHDKIQPLGMQESVSIKKYLHTNNKRFRRLENVVLADEREILWVPGVGLSERIKVTGHSTHKLRISEIAPDAQLA